MLTQTVAVSNADLTSSGLDAEVVCGVSSNLSLSVQRAHGEHLQPQPHYRNGRWSAHGSAMMVLNGDHLLMMGVSTK